MAYVIFQAVAESERRAALSRVEACRDDLRRLREVAGGSESLPFFLVSVPISPTAAFEAISGLPRGCRTTGEAVLSVLNTAGARLFGYGSPTIEAI